jgi:phosphoserine aminotransferase
MLAGLNAPVVNRPERVAATGRCENLARLARLPDVRAPRAARVARARLQGPDAVAALQAQGIDFPLLLRSPGYHTGEHFLRVAAPADLPTALAALPGDELLAIEFIDVRGRDALVRKYRVMMIGGELLPLHLAISPDWKVHYFSAAMADHPAHRAEEAAFLAGMERVLGERAMRALQDVRDCLGLDYAGVDFAIDADGALVVFEANATMAVFAPDPDTRWDYRRPAVARVDAAVRRLLLERARKPAAPGAAHAASVAPAAPAALHRNELNFSAGPGALPQAVLEQARQAILELPETGLSVLGMSHRSAWFEALLEEAERNLRELLSIPQSHAVLFLQGGSSLQFSMIPMNFARPGDPAPRHVRSGYWSAKAIEEARCVRPLELAWDGQPGGYRHLPPADAFAGCDAAGLPYLHYVSNETVEGLQFALAPQLERVPLIADMSSDFLSRPIDFRRHAMVYAHAQKNLGPAGVTVCVIDRALLERVPDGLPPMLDYRTHLRHRSNYNTPPVFGIYTMTLVTRWVRDTVGGLAAMTRSNAAKSRCLYAALDGLGELVQVHAAREFRSAMNASFRFREARLDAAFLAEAAQAGFSGLAGHRALGGIRASLYNAVSERAVSALADLLEDFARRSA